MPLLLSKRQGKSYQPIRGRLIKGAGAGQNENISPARQEKQQLKKYDDSVKSERKKLFQAWTRF
jgi:hypothetical protein